MFIAQAYWSLDTYIARFSLIIYYHSMFYSLNLRHGATIVRSYCSITMSDTMVAPVRHFYQTINSTI